MTPPRKRRKRKRREVGAQGFPKTARTDEALRWVGRWLG
jgi:hypothetical protein